MRSLYPKDEGILSFKIFVDPFLACIMKRHHSCLNYVLELVDVSLWNRLVKSARLVLLSCPELQFTDSYSILSLCEDDLTKIENDMYYIVQLLGDCSYIMSVFVLELVTPLLFILFPTRLNGVLKMENTDQMLKARRHIDKAEGIDFCTLTWNEANQSFGCDGWLTYCVGNVALPAKHLLV